MDPSWSHKKCQLSKFKRWRSLRSQTNSRVSHKKRKKKWRGHPGIFLPHPDFSLGLFFTFLFFEIVSLIFDSPFNLLCGYFSIRLEGLGEGFQLKNESLEQWSIVLNMEAFNLFSLPSLFVRPLSSRKHFTILNLEGRRVSSFYSVNTFIRNMQNK